MGAAGDKLLSKVVNAAIGFKPLYAVMKVAAKQVLKSTAERNGIPWDGTVRQMQSTPEVFHPSDTSAGAVRQRVGCQSLHTDACHSYTDDVSFLLQGLPNQGRD
jgi:hypothetical protein